MVLGIREYPVDIDADKLIEFNNAILSAKNLTQQKRFYMSTYGFKNSREVILGEQDTLVKADNYDRFSIDQIVSWWRKKASRRLPPGASTSLNSPG